MKSNKYLLASTAAVLVKAYKSVIADYQKILPLDLQVSGNAPSNYDSLISEASAGLLRVTSEFSNTAIYGRDGNVTFRVMHDYGHILYKAEFTTEQEVELAKRQWVDIEKYIPQSHKKIAEVVYLADTVEQSKFEALTGEFPKDQKAFVLAFMPK